MNGIASLLDEHTATLVERVWQDLESHCGLVGVKITPFPHISWQVTESYEISQLDDVLSSFAKQISPFTIHTNGIGLFSSEKPVIYLSIVKDEPLIHFHSMLWEKTKEIAFHPVLLYSPDWWVPHITIAYNDVTPASLGCAMQYLAFQSFAWEIQLDNLVLVAQDENQFTHTKTYHFGAKE